MPKARRRKDTNFQSTVTKSVFLYGRPNKGKLALLKQMQRTFTALVNEDILALDQTPSVFMQLVKNDKKDPEMRKLEKSVRKSGINSAFCQNAFDCAVTHLSNRLENIRMDLLREGFDIFAKSKILFGMSVTGHSKADMIAALEEIGQKFHLECATILREMDDGQFRFIQQDLLIRYQSISMEYRIPQLRSVSVPLDSRLMRLEPSVSTSMPYVISITDPFHSGKRIQVPINTSAHSLHKIRSNRMAKTVMMQVHDGNLRIGWSYGLKLTKPTVSKQNGVDIGITDALYTSDGPAIGSMKEAINFYHSTVEPSFAELSDLRNKKRAIRHYLRTHDLSEDVRRSLIRKMDHLDQMMKTIEAPYRKKRHYYAMLDQEIVNTVDAYIRSIDRNTLTVLEKLDIREFNKSRKLNGEFSMFARGRLQGTLMRELNWRGYDFLEVVPDYTSQVCLVCGNLDPENRNGKDFTCTCCSHHDDADHNAAVNIRDRVNDAEIMKLCESYRYNHAGLQKALKALYHERNQNYQTQHPLKSEPPSAA